MKKLIAGIAALVMLFTVVLSGASVAEAKKFRVVTTIFPIYDWVRMRGNLSYFQDPEPLNEYFAVIIADATACCAQGIEFVWDGHKYPEDYPPLDTVVTVTGTFGTYEEAGFTYLQLTGADVVWET